MATDVINERYGKLEEATKEQRVEAARELVKALVDKVPGYSYTLNASPGKKKPDEYYVTLFINGPGGTRPGKIGMGKYATPLLFPQDEHEAEKFITAAEKAGINIRVFSRDSEEF